MGLVDVDWLAEHLDAEDVRVVDVRWYLSGERRGRDAYLEGHVPGAAFVDLDTALAAPDDGTQGRHPMPDTETFQSAMRAAGINHTSHVVAYDDAGGAIAARLWWLLRAHGHEKVSLLDGGWPAWLAASKPVESGARTTRAGNFVARGQSVPALSLDEVRQLQRAGAVLVDVRAPERYRGESEPVDPRPGHIPGAVNLPVSALLRDGRFLPETELAERLGQWSSDVPLVASCGSGVTACHLLFALDLTGVRPFPSAKLYAGSYSEWARRTELPVAVGPGPGEPS